MRWRVIDVLLQCKQSRLSISLWYLCFQVTVSRDRLGSFFSVPAGGAVTSVRCIFSSLPFYARRISQTKLVMLTSSLAFSS